MALGSYTSSARFLGLPLVDVQVGAAAPSGDTAGGGTRGVARGWIAVGDVSIGVLVSVGGLAVGGIALGGLAVGVVPLGGVAAGLLAIGGAAFGWWSAGGAAFAVRAAIGGLAVAASFAEGGVAVASHANDVAASTYFSGGAFPALRFGLAHSRWLILFALLPVLLPPMLRRKQDA